MDLYAIYTKALADAVRDNPTEHLALRVIRAAVCKHYREVHAVTRTMTEWIKLPDESLVLVVCPEGPPPGRDSRVVWTHAVMTRAELVLIVAVLRYCTEVVTAKMLGTTHDLEDVIWHKEDTE
jgi:hypothetical protein